MGSPQERGTRKNVQVVKATVNPPLLFLQQVLDEKVSLRDSGLEPRKLSGGVERAEVYVCECMFPNYRSRRLGTRRSVFRDRKNSRDTLIRGQFGDQPIGPDLRSSAWEQTRSNQPCRSLSSDQQQVP